MNNSLYRRLLVSLKMQLFDIFVEMSKEMSKYTHREVQGIKNRKFSS